MCHPQKRVITELHGLLRAEDMGLEPTTGKPGNTVPVCLLANSLILPMHSYYPMVGSHQAGFGRSRLGLVPFLLIWLDFADYAKLGTGCPTGHH